MSRGGHNKPNLIGQRFGRLVVIKEMGRTKCQKVLWHCICDCKGTAMPTTGALRSGQTQSCGCLHRERQKLPNMKLRLPYGEAALNALYAQYQHGAKRRGLNWSLSKYIFKKLTQQKCFYCGAKPTQITKTKNDTTGRYFYNGIDRVNNKRGYVKENCIPCCKICNVAKHSMTQKQFYHWIKQVYNYNIKGK